MVEPISTVITGAAALGELSALRSQQKREEKPLWEITRHEQALYVLRYNGKKPVHDVVISSNSGAEAHFWAMRQAAQYEMARIDPEGTKMVFADKGSAPICEIVLSWKKKAGKERTADNVREYSLLVPA